jgi:hypothetical protein
MWLHEAIRLGALSAPQGEGSAAATSNLEPLRLCALGAAVYAVGVLKKEMFLTDLALRDIFPILRVRVLVRNQPVNFELWAGTFNRRERTNVSSAIWRLNDNAHWTREMIADWVQSFETEIYAKRLNLIPKEVTVEVQEAEPLACQTQC